MNEAELVARCKQKEPSAQAELYRRYAGELFALCIRYAGNRETAKDLLHDGFLKAFTSLDKFDYRGEGSLKAWLSRIMVNTALEEARKQAQHFDVDLDEIEFTGYEGLLQHVWSIPTRPTTAWCNKSPPRSCSASLPSCPTVTARYSTSTRSRTSRTRRLPACCISTRKAPRRSYTGHAPY